MSGQGRKGEKIARSIVRLGRLLELASIPPEEREAFDVFRRRLLQSFVTLANEGADDREAEARLDLFEEALRRARAAGRSDRPLPLRAGGGIVSLVGAGPGDAGLLTLRAAQRLREADVVYHDALVSAEVLACCRPQARLVPVGKRRGSAPVPQSQIEADLVREARSGLRVVRLKGGDPFVFGRGGEEALTLLRAGVPFEVVPGVTSGTSVPALAGIPLTHRGVSRSAAFLTAHDLTGTGDGRAARARLAHLARGAETLVLFMAGAELDRVRRTLLGAGLAASTPAALIESGTTPDERSVLGTIGDLPDLLVRLAPNGGPLLAVIGGTVALAAEIGPAMTAVNPAKVTRAQSVGTEEIGKISVKKISGTLSARAARR